MFPSVLGPQGIQVRDRHSKIRPDHLDAISKAYDIPDDVFLRAVKGDDMVDWVIDGPQCICSY